MFSQLNYRPAYFTLHSHTKAHNYDIDFQIDLAVQLLKRHIELGVGLSFFKTFKTLYQHQIGNIIYFLPGYIIHFFFNLT